VRENNNKNKYKMGKEEGECEGRRILKKGRDGRGRGRVREREIKKMINKKWEK
jgi:hypothetical protein